MNLGFSYGFFRFVSVAVSVCLFGVVLSAAPVSGDHGDSFNSMMLYEKAWETRIAGSNRKSSPVIADIDSDGRNEIVFGHSDGKLRAYETNGELRWEVQAVPGPSQENCATQNWPSAIESSPAVADIDGDGVFEVIVGVGSATTSARNQNGSVIAFDGRNGSIEWSFAHSRDTGDIWDGQTDTLDGWCEATFATPAIADVDGDGAVDVVFGSYDFFIWAVDGKGNPLPGFPINNDDTIWSSPALFDVDNDGDAEIFIGGDSTPGGWIDHLGGIFRAVDYRNGAPVTMWLRKTGEVIHSSPAIADINGDGRYEAVVGSGDNWFIQCNRRRNPLCRPGNGLDNTKVWAFHLDDGSDVPGWPVRASGTVWSSPSVGDVDGDGELEVVVGSDDRNVYAWNGDGSLQWSTIPQFAHIGDGEIIRSSAVIADLDGDSDQDVAIGTSKGIALLDGRNGSGLEDHLWWEDRMAFETYHESVPAVGTFNGERHIVYWGNDVWRGETVFAAFKLPSAYSHDAWPMFRHGPDRLGTASISRSAGQVRFYTRPIQWLVETNIIDLGSAPSASPNTPATRGETALYMWRVEDSPTAAPHPFSDVSGRELNDAVAWMYASGITTGKTTSSGSFFAADDRLTRAEVAAFLYRCAGQPEASKHPFRDVTSPWQQKPVAWLATSGITQGTSPDTFSPNSLVTRGELATFLHRFKFMGIPPRQSVRACVIRTAVGVT
ncbi:MAG: FG-GAP-like repeat-containing protein [Acidimicrobiaceae bacterium]|nr:FG-GAP-like repeat-containing protein [Acidimicrobiaceae bacterium]